MRQHAILTTLLIGAFLAPAASAEADDAWVSGSWVGFTETYASFFRLDLRSGGEGMLANASRARGDVQVYLYKVRWSLDGTKIKLNLKQLDPNSPPIRAKGRVSTNEILLEISRKGSTSAKSVKTLRLYPEAVLEEQIVLLKERMAEAGEE